MEKIINLGTSYGNAYALPCGDKYCLIDTGYPFDYKHFLRKTKKCGVDLNKIKYIVVTHVHADHVGFLQPLLEKTQATLVCATEDKDRFLSGWNVEETFISRFDLWLLSKLSVLFRRFTQKFPPVTYQNVVDADEQPLLQYGITLQKLSGHTQNDLCAYYKDMIFCGDICMNGTGATNHAPMWIENNDKLVESWEKLLQSNAKTLCPTHGKPFPLQDLSKCVEKQRNKTLKKL